jgi:acid stress-induced BolA-like protein IbaG/YrbA
MISNQIIHDTLSRAGAFKHLVVEGDGYHYHITLVSDLFSGMLKVKRQQWVYDKLNDYILSGALHAISIKAFTPAEWSQVNG